MKITVFDTHAFERPIFDTLNTRHELHFLETRLSPSTAILAKGSQVVCAFVNDHVDAVSLQILQTQGIKLIALRSAGYNHVDLKAARSLGMPVVRVPAYSPHAIAEHAVCLILALNRKIHRAWNRVREHNFSLDGLVGFNLEGKTVGVVGTGRIGAVFAQIMHGFGCKILAYDRNQRPELNALANLRYVKLDELIAQSDLISLHVPLTPETKHLIDQNAISRMKKGTMLINTGRGALIDAKALIDGLKSGQVGSAGLDVYEEEEGIFFQDLSDQVLQDDTLARLLTFPNVLVTSHQAFLTQEALKEIVTTTLQNISDFEDGRALKNQVS